MKVEFESETAGRIFYETLSQPAFHPSAGESKTMVEIPIVFEHRRRVVTGPNVAFNNAVTQCDTNADGKITELEAKIFANRHGQRKS